MKQKNSNNGGTIQVSSNLTLMLKFFIPIFWLGTLGLITIGIYSLDLAFIGMFPVQYVRIAFIVFFGIALLLCWFTFMKIKRVEMGPEYFYVSNYFKTYKYTYDSINKIQERNYGIIKTVRIVLNEKGKLGKRLSFIPSRSRFDKFLSQHPNLSERLLHTSVDSTI